MFWKIWWIFWKKTYSRPATYSSPVVGCRLISRNYLWLTTNLNYDPLGVHDIVKYLPSRYNICKLYLEPPKFHNMMTLNILFTNIFQWSIENNYKYYDFGLFTVNGVPNLSLARFKESFGSIGTFRKTMVLKS